MLQQNAADALLVPKTPGHCGSEPHRCDVQGCAGGHARAAGRSGAAQTEQALPKRAAGAGTTAIALPFIQSEGGIAAAAATGLAASHSNVAACTSIAVAAAAATLAACLVEAQPGSELRALQCSSAAAAGRQCCRQCFKGRTGSAGISVAGPAAIFAAIAAIGVSAAAGIAAGAAASSSQAEISRGWRQRGYMAAAARGTCHLLLQRAAGSGLQTREFRSQRLVQAVLQHHRLKHYC